MKTYMIGIRLIDAKNLNSAKNKYTKLIEEHKKEILKEKAQRIAWLDSTSVKTALKRLTSAR